MPRSEEGIKFRHLVLKGWNDVELATTVYLYLYIYIYIYVYTDRLPCFLHPVEPGTHVLEHERTTRAWPII